MLFTNYDRYECVATLDKPLKEIEQMPGDERAEPDRAERQAAGCHGRHEKRHLERNGTYREEASDVNPHAYVNHTWLKKFGSFLFSFDAEFENKYLFAKPGETIENEWRIDESGAFGPGTIPKKPRIGKTMPTPKMRTP